MTATRAAVLAVLLVVGATAAAPAAGAPIADLVGSEDDATETTDRPLGTDVSSFMQASAADANDSVDAGLFVAAYETGDDETRQTVVLERTDQLERRLAQLETEHERLVEREGEPNDVAYEARMTRLTVRLDALREALDETAPRAEAVGVDAAALNEIRRTASNLSGPEIAAIATGMAGIDPPGPPDGLPGNWSEDDPGRNGNASSNSGSGGNGASADAGDGASADAGDGASADAEDGASADAGEWASTDAGNRSTGNDPGTTAT